MTDALISIVVAAAIAPLMELWSRFLHGRIWHGILFPIHRSHHVDRHGRFEANDLLSATHAPIAATLIIVGCVLGGLLGAVLRGVGAGMTLFGVAYVVVHDGFVHGRLPVQGLARLRFFRRVRAAHRMHHRTGGPPYGLFAGVGEMRRRHHENAPAKRLVAHRALARGPSEPSTSR